MYVNKDDLIEELFFQPVCKSSFTVNLLISTRFLQLVIDHKQAKTRIPYEISGPTAFEAKLYFYALALVSRKIR